MPRRNIPLNKGLTIGTAEKRYSYSSTDRYNEAIETTIEVDNRD